MKQNIRNLIKKKCKELSQVQRDYAADSIVEHILPLLTKAQHIAIYHACEWEISLNKLITYCLGEGKSLYQPVAYKDTRFMLLEPYRSENTKIFSPVEYKPREVFEWQNLDILLLPLVAAAKNGVRLGKGGGYYDATLAQLKPIKGMPILCGVGFSCQLVDTLPMDEWDIRLDYLVTEDRLIEFD
jgi:5-formyltetrahydrofolate cyclo-ligase